MESSDKYELNDLEITEIKEEETIEIKNNKQDEYYISEPFDYIFEPDHYPKHSNPKKSNIFKHARIVRDRDGILEYEYQSYAYTNNIPDEHLNLEDLDLFYLNNFDYETHLHGLTRNVTLPKWPHVGFGFSLAKHKMDNEELVYVNEVLSDSPAEFCLQLGDILLEMDDLNLRNTSSIADLQKHIEQKEKINLMVIHKSKYARLKSENGLGNTFFNCENFVICNHKNEQNKI